MLSLTELRRAAALLEALIAGHRLQAVAEPDEHGVVLTTYGGANAPSGDGDGGHGGSGRRHVRLSCRPQSARVSLVERASGRGEQPGACVQYLRAHCVGGRIGGIRLLDDDRQLAIRVSAEDGEFDLLLSILGPRSNLYVLDGEGRIAVALRPLADTRPELELGGPWRSPASKPPTEGVDRFAAEPDHRYLRAIEDAYAQGERADEADGLRRRLDQALRKEARALDRKLEKLGQSLAEARDAERLAREGELLKGVLGKIRRGDREAQVTDHESGETLAIALDPKLTPSENLDRLFKRYRKAIRSLAKSGAREDAVREARAEVAGWLDRFAELIAEGEDDRAALEAFADESPVRRLLEKYSPAPQLRRGAAPAAKPEVRLGKHVVPRRLAPRRYRTAGGLEIWVGRSAAGNDHLSIRLARGKDLFFHLDGAPGSHVILRTEGRVDPPAEAVLDACELAVHFSKFKNATRADVHAVPIANVRKPKGAKPGLVTVHGGRTIHLRRSDARLERVLQARIED